MKSCTLTKQHQKYQETGCGGKVPGRILGGRFLWCVFLFTHILPRAGHLGLFLIRRSDFACYVSSLIWEATLFPCRQTTLTTISKISCHSQSSLLGASTVRACAMTVQHLFGLEICYLFLVFCKETTVYYQSHQEREFEAICLIFVQPYFENVCYLFCELQTVPVSLECHMSEELSLPPLHSPV